MIGALAVSELPVASLRQLLVLASGLATATAEFNFRIVAATHEFSTPPTDTIANLPFAGTLQRALRVDRTIVSDGGFGRLSVSWGELELINADGAYDDIVNRYTIDGRRVLIKIGALGRDYSTFRTIFDGTASDWHVAEDVLRITLRDNGYKLGLPASPNVYAGTGGLAGGSDLTGKRKPLALGAVDNVSPSLVIPAELLYQIHDGPVQAISAVYDRGSALTPDVDYATATLLRAATVPAGRFATCLADGLFRLGGAPAGTVTADVQGDKTGGVYASMTGAIVRRILSRATGVADPGGLVTTAFTALDALQSAVVGFWLPSDATTTVREVVDALLGGIGAWGDFRRDGLFQVGRFDAPSGSPFARYTPAEIIAIAREKLPSAFSPTPWRFRVAWGRNWTVQTDLAGSVAAARVAYLAEAFRSAASSDTTTGAQIRSSHPLAQDPDPLQSYFRDQTDAQTEADRLLTLYSVTRSLYRITLKLQPYIHEVGDVIHATYPRWDLTSGRLLRIVGLSEDPDNDQIEVMAFG